MMGGQKRIILLCQLLIGLVLASNLFAALTFIVAPQAYVAGFQLEGVPGIAAVVGIGILFMMWQVPYGFALYDPTQHFISLNEAIIMQIFGLLGESLLYSKIEPSYWTLRLSIARFILFDGLGLALLIIAWAILSRIRQNLSNGGQNV